jgi:hypothetical protein
MLPHIDCSPMPKKVTEKKDFLFNLMFLWFFRNIIQPVVFVDFYPNSNKI